MTNHIGKVTIIIPAMDEESIIGQVVQDVRQVMVQTDFDFEILVVDDGSSDDTGISAEQAGATIIRHAYNMGNGAAIKTGIRSASGQIVVMMDGDGQHNPWDIPRLLTEMEKHAMVVGARSKTSQTQWHRDLANMVYNLLATYVCSRRIPDLTSGFRAIWTSLARSYVYLLPNTFSYPTTLTLAVIRAGHCVKYIQIEATPRVGKSKIKPLRDGMRFLVIIFRIATLFSPLKVFLPVSLGLLILGIVWYIYNFVFVYHHFPPTSVILILSSIFVFLTGLVSEQVAQLRFDRSEVEGSTSYKSEG
jgi:glycosyltransferase involved in cell wall biosynthesis